MVNNQIARYSIFNVNYANVDYTTSTEVIISNAVQRKSFGVSALAVHGLMTSQKEGALKRGINKIDLIVPDGQPVRWAMNSFYNLKLKDRVYGPKLTWHVLQEAEKRALRVFLFGSTKETLDRLITRINENFPSIIICGSHVDRFREATTTEDEEDIRKINDSGANIVLVGRGCPRQELWVINHLGKVDAVMMAVGAAFDFHAGTLSQAPEWMQRFGLEWFFRLSREPRRLWKRYLFTNTEFVLRFIYHKVVLQRANR